MAYVPPITGTGTAQAMTTDAQATAINTAIDAAVLVEAGTRAAADTALDARLDVVESSSGTAVQPGDAVSVLAETVSAKIMTAAERTKLAGAADGVQIDSADMGARIALATVGNNVPLWVDGQGRLAAKGLAPALVSAILGGVLTAVDVTGPQMPMVIEGDRVPFWRKADGTLQGKGLAAPALYAPQVTADPIPASTDGRTLGRARAKAALARAGSGKLVVAGLGDSWMQGVPIPNAFQAWLAATFGDCDKGWIHANSGGHWSGVTVTPSGGWTAIDGDVDNSPPYGQGPDGQMLYATGTTDTIAITTAAATEIRLYTRKQGGVWRYRVDGGSWTTVTEGASDGSVRVTTITGLTDATHTVNIDLTGNGATVAFCGAYSLRAAAKSAFLKMGNGGSTGYDLRRYFNTTGTFWSNLAPDLVLVVLGTNDYVYAESPPAEYELALTDIITTLRAACGSDVGIVLVAPALSPTTPITPLWKYRDSAYAVALAQRVEFLNLYDLITPQAVDASVWTDTRHLNQQGGDIFARLLNFRLLGV